MTARKYAVGRMDTSLQYSRVTVNRGTSGEGGKSVYTFDLADWDSPLQNEGQNEEARPLTVEQFRYDGPNSFTPLSKIEYEYQYAPTALQSDYRLYELGGVAVRRTLIDAVATPYNHEYERAFFILGPLWNPMVSMTETNYFDSYPSQITETEYTYESNYPFQLKQQRVVNSDGEISLVEYVHPFNGFFQGDDPESHLLDYLDDLKACGENFFSCYDANLNNGLATCDATQRSSFNTSKSTYTSAMNSYQSDLDNQISAANGHAKAIFTMQDKNILIPAVETRSWHVLSGGGQELTGAKKNEFVVLSDNIFLDKQFTFNSITPVAQSVFNSNPSNYYRITGEVDQYNSVNKVLEYHPANGPHEVVIRDHENSLPIAKVVNASYDEVAYSSFEIPGATSSGFWTISSSNSNNWEAISHTGLNGLRIPNQGEFVSRTVGQSGTFSLSFWYQGEPEVIIDGTSTLLPSKNEWTYWESSFSLSSSDVVSIESGGTSPLIDELRLHPSDAMMETYCYDDNLRIHTMTDSRNVSSYYLYDGLGRLETVRDQDGNIIRRSTIRFSGEQ